MGIITGDGQKLLLNAERRRDARAHLQLTRSPRAIAIWMVIQAATSEVGSCAVLVCG